jgi:hypothetical protein
MPARITESAASSLDGQRIYSPKRGQRQAVREAQLHQEARRIDLDGVVGSSQAVTNRTFNAAPHPGFTSVWHIRL